MKQRVNVIDLDKTLIPFDSLRLFIFKEIFLINLDVITLTIKRLLKILNNSDYKASLIKVILKKGDQEYFDVFAWAFLKLENGGCVANIGATRSAYTFVDKDGVYAGAGYLDVHFFKAYEEGIKVGEMLTSAQRDYANYVGKDFFTIEEYILLGDPSLRVGGYP